MMVPVIEPQVLVPKPKPISEANVRSQHGSMSHQRHGGFRSALAETDELHAPAFFGGIDVPLDIVLEQENLGGDVAADERIASEALAFYRLAMHGLVRHTVDFYA